jgi:hypothetical protein
MAEPREGDGYCADVETENHRLRLFSAMRSEYGGWVASVYDLSEDQWIVEHENAHDALAGKQAAMELASHIVEAELPNLNWYECPEGWSTRQD